MDTIYPNTITTIKAVTISSNSKCFFMLLCNSTPLYSNPTPKQHWSARSILKFKLEWHCFIDYPESFLIPSNFWTCGIALRGSPISLGPGLSGRKNHFGSYSNKGGKFLDNPLHTVHKTLPLCSFLNWVSHMMCS